MTLCKQNEIERILIFAKDVLNSFVDKQRVEIPNDKIFFESRGVRIVVYFDDKEFEKIVYPQLDVSLSENLINALQDVYEKFKSSSKFEDVKIILTLFGFPKEIEGDVEKDFELGDGLMCNYVGYKGILFPDNNRYLDKLRFLEGVCLKARLTKDSWQNPNMKFASFQSQEIGRVI